MISISYTLILLMYICRKYLEMNRIKELIKEKGYTQEQFAKELGISRAALIQQLDKPSYPTMEKYSSVLGVPMWMLFASAEDIARDIGSDIVTCPHCHKRFKIVPID